MVKKGKTSLTRFGVVVFPGSNCERDTLHALGLLKNASVRPIWHKESALSDIDVLVLPGGFSYGDYLRCGSIARFSPIMKSVIAFANGGGTVIGICNGFQVLVESGLLPGALLPNSSRKFICRDVYVKVERNGIPAVRNLPVDSVLKVPIAHHDGNYYADDKTIRSINEKGQIVLRYCDKEGNVTEEANPNGSLLNIAGICNEKGNVFGLMPHPERCAEAVLGNTDGKRILESLASG